MAFVGLKVQVPDLASQTFTQITDKSERIEMLGVSLLPPQEDGWHIIRRHPGRAEFGRLGENGGQSFSGMVVLSKLPDVTTEEQFRALISAQRQRDSSNSRFENVSNEETLSHEKGALAVRFRTKYKDFSAVNSPASSKYLIVDDIGIIIQHPANKNIAVFIALSQRSKPMDASESFEQLALEFIANARLTALGLSEAIPKK